MVLVDRDRINLLNSVISKYLELVYETASIKTIEVLTAFPFTNSQKNYVNSKIKRINKCTRNSINN
jgi:F0F1-type ATP synthase delta subunit